MTQFSPRDIACCFGVKDRAALLRARRKIGKKMADDPAFLKMVDRLQSDIRAAER